MRHGVMLVLAGCLSGCALNTAVIRSQTATYDDIIEDTTNKLLLLNILRAKDNAPLHFDAIPSIHASIQESAGVTASWPFGPSNKSSQRNGLGGSMGIQLNPSFEIDHIDTKDFATGVASPIDPKFVKYWLDRGLDRRIALLLFFSAVDIVDTDDTGSSTVLRIRNSPRDAIDSLNGQMQANAPMATEELRCDSQSDFQRYLKFINSLTTFSAHSYTERRLLAQNLTIDLRGSQNGLKDIEAITGLDPNKFQWVRNADQTYNIYAISPGAKTALCFSDVPISQGGQPISPASCRSSVVDSADTVGAGYTQSPLSAPLNAEPGQAVSNYCTRYNQFIQYNRALQRQDASKPAQDIGKHRWEIRLEIRSVGEIIQFLGDLLEYQEQLATAMHAHPGSAMRLNNPLTFGYCADENAGRGNPGCADVFFHLRSDRCDTRFSVNYRGRLYAVPNFNPAASSSDQDGGCDGPAPGGADGLRGKDHSLEVLAVVHQLLDLQKSAQDIKETPYVQVLP